MSWLQFSLRGLLAVTAIVAAFFAGDAAGRRRENYRMNRIRDIQEELEIIRRTWHGERLPAAEMQEVNELIQELESIGWTWGMRSSGSFLKALPWLVGAALVFFAGAQFGRWHSRQVAVPPSLP